MDPDIYKLCQILDPEVSQTLSQDGYICKKLYLDK
jgi:hypothetical protein